MDDAALAEALRASQRLGMLGDRPIGAVIEHASAFVAALAGSSGTVVDLGAGGGVPGLVIARARPDLHVVLVDRRATRTDHLRRLVGRLGLTGQVDVLNVDARELRLPVLVEAVVARGFGPPAVMLRCAVPLLASGGIIVVSEPPDSPADRWPQGLLDDAGVVAVDTPDRRVARFQRADVSRGT